MQDQGPSSCLWAVFSQRTTEGNGWSHPAPLKWTNLLHSCLSISFSKVILCQLFGKAWCGLNIFFSHCSLIWRKKAQVVEVAMAGRWHSPDVFQRVEGVSRRTFSVRAALGMVVSKYGLWGWKPRRNSNRAVFEMLGPAGIMGWFYLTCEHLW